MDRYDTLQEKGGRMVNKTGYCAERLEEGLRSKMRECKIRFGHDTR